MPSSLNNFGIGGVPSVGPSPKSAYLEICKIYSLQGGESGSESEGDESGSEESGSEGGARERGGGAVNSEEDDEDQEWARLVSGLKSKITFISFS